MTQPSITSTTHTLPFDKLSPRDFERLCLWLVERTVAGRVLTEMSTTTTCSATIRSRERR